jgi:hypothetical protein
MGTEFQHRVAGDTCKEIADNIDHYIQDALLNPLRLEGEQRAFERGAKALDSIFEKAKADNSDGTLSDEAWVALVPYLRACKGKLMVLAQDTHVAKIRAEGRLLGLQNAKKIADGHAATHAAQEASAKEEGAGRFGKNSNEGRFGNEVQHAEFELVPDLTLEEPTNSEPPPELEPEEVVEEPVVEVVEPTDTTDPLEGLQALMDEHSLGSLRKLAKSQGIRVGGKKKELAERILTAS